MAIFGIFRTFGMCRNVIDYKLNIGKPTKKKAALYIFSPFRFF